MQEKVYVNPDHACQMLYQMSELWKEKKFCDASLEIGDLKIQVHKLVLVSASPHLLSIADTISTDSKLEVHLPPTVDLESVNVFLSYLYDGALHLTSRNVLSIETIAKLLQMPRVTKFCDDFIELIRTSEKAKDLPAPRKGRSRKASASQSREFEGRDSEEDSKAKIRRLDNEYLSLGECSTSNVQVPVEKASEENTDSNTLPVKIKTEPLDEAETQPVVANSASFDPVAMPPGDADSLTASVSAIACSSPAVSPSVPLMTTATVSQNTVSNPVKVVAPAIKPKPVPIAPKPQTAMLQIPSTAEMNTVASGNAGAGNTPFPLTLVTSDGKPVELLKQGKYGAKVTPTVDSTGMSSRAVGYRKKLKVKDPEKYKEYLEAQKLRSKRAREKLREELAKTEPAWWAIEKNEYQKERQRQRQRKYVEKLKEKTQSDDGGAMKVKKTKIVAKLQIRSAENTNKREYWRTAKQRERKNMSEQKKTWLKNKDREWRKQKRDAEKVTYSGCEQGFYLD